MPFRSFVEAASQRGTGSHETDLNYYLQVPLVSPGAAQSTPVALEAELRDLGWAWLHSACEAAASQPLQALQLWAGHGVGMTPCHFEYAPARELRHARSAQPRASAARPASR